MRELRAVLRTPSEVVFDEAVAGIRFPTPTGQVGLRPGAEPMVTALLPGLVVLGRPPERRFAGTAGGVLRHDGAVVMLFSPFVSVGTAEDVLVALEAARSDEEGELAALRRLEELESRITVEARTDLSSEVP